MKDLIFELCKSQGISGDENKAAEFALDKIKKYAKAEKLPNGSVVACLGNEKSKKRILLDAHIDQVGFVVTGIDDNGFIRFAPCGGNDRRIMPGSVERVFGKEEVIGVVSCLPPHLIKDSCGKLPSVDEMTIDLGMSKEETEKIVSPGDSIIYNSEPRSLIGSRIASKALDNRASVAALIRCAELISENKSILENCFVKILFSSQEETSSLGAITSSFDDDYSESIVVDVTFATQPGVTSKEAGYLSKGPMIGVSPVLSKEITEKLFLLAKNNNIIHQTEVMGGKTGTNADKISIVKSGIKTGLISIPQRNMHTAVEVMDIEDIENTAKLLACYIEQRGLEDDRL